MRAILHVVAPGDYDAWRQGASIDATRMAKVRRELKAELGKGRGPATFPVFGKDPAVTPNGWAWSWQEGLD